MRFKTSIIIIFLSLLPCVPAGRFVMAQSFTAENVKGDVQAQFGLSEKWNKVKDGLSLDTNTVVETGKKSSIEIKYHSKSFTLDQSSAINLKYLKKMSVDDVLLALAMEDMMNAPKKNDEDKAKSTAVYGAEENGKSIPFMNSDDFGIKRLNGAVKLTENGYEGSAVIFAHETFRKYPDTNNLPGYRIYFANVLYKLGLYREAYDDFSNIKTLKLDENQKTEVGSKLEDLRKKLAKE